MKQPLIPRDVFVNYDWDDAYKAYRKSKKIGETYLPFCASQSKANTLSETDSYDLLNDDIACTDPKYLSIADKFGFHKYVVSFANTTRDWVMSSHAKYGEILLSFGIPVEVASKLEAMPLESYFGEYGIRYVAS